MRKRWMPGIVLGFVFSLFASPLLAQSDETDSLNPDPETYLIKADPDSILGDNIDIDSGRLSFYVVDVSLPGNSKLPVQFGRRLSDSFDHSKYRSTVTTSSYNALGNWRFDAPQIIAYGGSCENPWGFRVRSEEEEGINEEQTITNYFYNVDSHSPSILDANSGPASYNLIGRMHSKTDIARLPSAQKLDTFPIANNPFPSSARYGTDDGWHLYCAGLHYTIAVAPNGTKYHFNVLGGRYASSQTPYLDSDDQTAIYASLVEDVHGNWVQYTYQGGASSNGAPVRLTRIHANDGREITIGYNSDGLVSTVTANNRVWTYEYSPAAMLPGHDGAHKALVKVTLPDGTFWNIGRAWSLARTNLSHECRFLEDLTVKHPNGTSGTFKFKHLRNGMTRVTRPSPDPYEMPQFCGDGHIRDDDPDRPDPRVFLSVAVTEKKLSGPNHPDYTWTYDYEEDGGSYLADGGLSDLKKRTVTDPNGDRRVTYINRIKDHWMAGIPERVETYNGASSSPVQTEEMEYVLGPQYGGSPARFTGLSRMRHGYFRHRAKTVITRGSDVFTTEYDYDTDFASPGFSFGRPTRIERYSNASSERRIEERTYEHKTARWILGLPKTVTRDGKLFDNFTYDSLGRATRHDRFGGLYKTFAYHGAGAQGGSLAWEQDALSQRTSYDNYKRGEPQLITRADSSTLSRVVDDNGWVTSETNAKGVTTGFEYNAAGWRTKIDRPAPWSDTMIAYSNLGAGVVQTTTRGSARTTTTHDGFLRPTLIKTEALSDGGLTTYVKTDYDGLGRTTFTSLRSASSNPTAGIDTTYDALGRVTQTRETVSPFATTAYAYLSGNRTRVIDPRGFSTTTTLRAYGSPDEGEVVKIQQPEGVTTDITYNDWGNMLSATQSGGGSSLTQRWVYDNRLRVCRHSVPETGDTLYEYDAADQQIAIARGQSFGTSCASLPSGSRIARTYDLLGRVTAVDYSGTTPDYAISYDANGNVTRNARGGVVWDYAYDTADQLTEEKLTVDGRLYATDYVHNTHGHLLSQTTPAGRIVNFAPNGLGQATRATAAGYDYAAGIAYHADGSLAGLTYGNGHGLTRGLNARQLVETIRVQKTGVKAVDLTYEYLPDGRISKKTDRATPLAAPPQARTVTAEYDASGRLSRASDTRDGAGWKTYAYDNRGNVTNNGRLSFVYDAAEQPVSMSGAASGAYVYDGNLKRVKQVIDGETIYSVYSQSGSILYRDNATTGVATDYVRAAGRTIARLKGSVTTFPHQDHLGSPVAETGLSGAVNWRESYAAYGEKRLDPVGNRDDEGFTGHIDDAATGLTYMQARYYDPVIGRFLSNDPVVFSVDRPQYFNRYSYCLNDPTNCIDPDGRQAADIDRALVIRAEMEAGATYEEAAAAASAQDAASRQAVMVAVDVATEIHPGTRGVKAAGRTARAAAQAKRSGSYDKGEVGSYTNTHESGKKYHGKGTRARSQQSGRRVERETGDRHTSTEFTGARSDREAFKDESKRIEGDGGPGSDSNYNRRESPGRRYREEDRPD